MTTCRLTVDPHTHTAHEYAGIIEGTLETITNELVNLRETADLEPDFWPAVYWASPDSFTLDDDEEEPPRPNYTTELVRSIAERVFDSHPRHITIETID